MKRNVFITGRVVMALACILALPAVSRAQEGAKPAAELPRLLGDPSAQPSPEHPVGWRGDGTGHYPGATPPLEWRITSKTLLGMSCQAGRPKDAAAPGKEAQPISNGFISQWLVLGPIDAPDLTTIDPESLPKEADLQPDEGEKAGAATWKAVKTEDSLLDLMPAGAQIPDKSVMYAHTYVYSKTGGQLTFHALHRAWLKIWLNGKEEYSKSKNYTGDPHDGHPFAVALAPGWNRLLVKLTPDYIKTNSNLPPACFVRLQFWSGDPAETYESKNIVWATPMPTRCFSSPVIAGDRIFVEAAPYDLVCLNKQDGKILWVRSNNYSDAAGSDEQKAHPDEFAKIEPLAKRRDEINQACPSATLPTEKVLEEKENLDFEIDKIMLQVDPQKYKRPHQENNFYSVPTPCTDGKFVYAWFADGVTVCYDRDGHRKWIYCDNRPGDPEHSQCSSPLLVAGKVVTAMRDIVAFDANTGAVAWKCDIRDEREKWNSCAAARIGQTDVVVATNGTLIRAADGVELSKCQGGGYVLTPVVYDGHAYMADYAGHHNVFTLPATADPTTASTAKFTYSGSVASNLVDPAWDMAGANWTMASQLCHDGLSYTVCSSAVLTVMDLKQSAQDKPAIVYQKFLPADYSPGQRPYACGVTASPALAADKYIFQVVSGNTTLVLEPGRQYKLLARNRIESPVVTERASAWNIYRNMWPEHLEGAGSAPVFEGSRLYLQAEWHLYCIGEK